MKLKNLIPMLNVSNIDVSLAFYKGALDFEVVSPEEALTEWRWCTIRSGETELMLSESQSDLGLKKNIDPHENTSWPTIFYFYPDDVEALYKGMKKKEFNVTPLELTFYGMKEFSIQDPDGHLLSFGQEAVED